jgi:hypothetical protein
MTPLFIVAATHAAAPVVLEEIFRIDPSAVVVSHERHPTVFLVTSRKMSVFTLQAIPGITHAVIR